MMAGWVGTNPAVTGTMRVAGAAISGAYDDLDNPSANDDCDFGAGCELQFRAVGKSDLDRRRAGSYLIAGHYWPGRNTGGQRGAIDAEWARTGNACDGLGGVSRRSACGMTGRSIRAHDQRSHKKADQDWIHGMCLRH